MMTLRFYVSWLFSIIQNQIIKSQTLSLTIVYFPAHMRMHTSLSDYSSSV